MMMRFTNKLMKSQLKKKYHNFGELLMTNDIWEVK